MADRLVIPLVRWEPRPACYCYGGTKLPARSALLAPDALAAILSLSDRLVLVTGYRSPLASATGWREDRARPAGKRKGVARPGFSPHGFGLAIDLDAVRTLALEVPTHSDTRPAWDDKADLDQALAAAGFRCWRDDHRQGCEWHHYTFSARAGGAKAMDVAILARWPDLATPDARRAQRLLAQTGDYAGKIDGKWGRQSIVAMATWCKYNLDLLPGHGYDGRLDRFSWRALLVGTADVRIGGAP